MVNKIINELIDEYDERYKSILSIPKQKNKNHFDTILLIIDYIEKRKPNIMEYQDWFKTNFSDSKNVCYNTRNILERANIITLRKDKYLITTTDIKKAINQKRVGIEIIKGYLETYQGMLEILYLCINYKTEADIYRIWRSDYASNMDIVRNESTHKSQFNIILQYLESFNLILKHNNYISTNMILIKRVLEYMQ